MVEALGCCGNWEKKTTRKGLGHPSSLFQRPMISVLSSGHSPTYGILCGTDLYQLKTIDDFVETLRDFSVAWHSRVAILCNFIYMDPCLVKKCTCCI